MSTVLYKLVNGNPEREMVNAIDVDRMLKDGYATNPKQLIPIKKSKKKAASDKEGKS